MDTFHIAMNVSPRQVLWGEIPRKDHVLKYWGFKYFQQTKYFDNNAKMHVGIFIYFSWDGCQNSTWKRAHVVESDKIGGTWEICSLGRGYIFESRSKKRGVKWNTACGLWLFIYFWRLDPRLETRDWTQVVWSSNVQSRPIIFVGKLMPHQYHFIVSYLDNHTLV